LSAEIVTLKTRQHNTPYPGVQLALEASQYNAPTATPPPPKKKTAKGAAKCVERKKNDYGMTSLFNILIAMSYRVCCAVLLFILTIFQHLSISFIVLAVASVS